MNVFKNLLLELEEKEELLLELDELDEPILGIF